MPLWRDLNASQCISTAYQRYIKVIYGQSPGTVKATGARQLIFSGVTFLKGISRPSQGAYDTIPRHFNFGSRLTQGRPHWDVLRQFPTYSDLQNRYNVWNKCNVRWISLEQLNQIRKLGYHQIALLLSFPMIAKFVHIWQLVCVLHRDLCKECIGTVLILSITTY